MAWVYLLIASIFEIVLAIFIKFNDGFTKPAATAATLLATGGAIYFLSLAARSLPISVAYTIWIGIGAVGTVLFGLLFFKEPVDMPKALCLIAIIAGVVGLKYLSGNTT